MPTPISGADDASRPTSASGGRREARSSPPEEAPRSGPVLTSRPAAAAGTAAAVAAASASAWAVAVAAGAAVPAAASRDALRRAMGLNLRPPCDGSRSSAPTPPSHSANRLLARWKAAGLRSG